MATKNTKTQIKEMWKFAMSLPCDGRVRCLPEVGLEAKHIPADAFRCPQILIRNGGQCYRRRFVRGSWARPEEVSGGAWC